MKNSPHLSLPCIDMNNKMLKVHNYAYIKAINEHAYTNLHICHRIGGAEVKKNINCPLIHTVTCNKILLNHYQLLC